MHHASKTNARTKVSVSTAFSFVVSVSLFSSKLTFEVRLFKGPQQIIAAISIMINSGVRFWTANDIGADEKSNPANIFEMKTAPSLILSARKTTKPIVTARSVYIWAMTFGSF